MTPDLKTCQELKQAGYPQDGAQQYWVRYYDDRDGSDYWRIETKNLYPDNGFAIPTLEPLLDWFTKDFAERWAEKIKVPIEIGPKLEYIQPGNRIYQSQYYGQWCFNVVASKPPNHVDTYRQVNAINPDPLTAVLELFKQMWKEMEDEKR